MICLFCKHAWAFVLCVSVSVCVCLCVCVCVCVCVSVCVCVCQRKTKDRADEMREKVPLPLRDSNLYLWATRPSCFRLHHESRQAWRQFEETLQCVRAWVLAFFLFASEAILICLKQENLTLSPVANNTAFHSAKCFWS